MAINEVKEATKHQISAWDIPYLEDVRIELPYVCKVQVNQSFEVGGLYGHRLFKLMFERITEVHRCDLVLWWVVHVNLLGYSLKAAIFIERDDRD